MGDTIIPFAYSNYGCLSSMNHDAFGGSSPGPTVTMLHRQVGCRFDFQSECVFNFPSGLTCNSKAQEGANREEKQRLVVSLSNSGFSSSLPV